MDTANLSRDLKAYRLACDCAMEIFVLTKEEIRQILEREGFIELTEKE